MKILKQDLIDKIAEAISIQDNSTMVGGGGPGGQYVSMIPKKVDPYALAALLVEEGVIKMESEIDVPNNS